MSGHHSSPDVDRERRHGTISRWLSIRPRCLYIQSFSKIIRLRFLTLHLWTGLISPALQQYAKNMLLPTKKTHISCMGLLAELSEMSLHNEATPYGKFRSQSIAISGPKTPRASISQHYGSSPEKDYFRSPPPRTRHTSRWKEDWEELELLVRYLSVSVTCSIMLTRRLCRVKALLALSSKLAIRSTRVYMPVSSQFTSLISGTKFSFSQEGKASHKSKRLENFQRSQHFKSIFPSFYREVLYDLGGNFGTDINCCVVEVSF